MEQHATGGFRPQLDAILTEELRKNQGVQKITHPKLIDVEKTSCTASTAFEYITLHDPEQQEIM